MGNPSNQRLIAIATVVSIALLGCIGYLLYNKVNQDKLIKQQSAELISTEKLQASLEKEYYQALADLEEMRGTNEELNALIDTQKGELKSQKERISTLLKSAKDLEIAKEEINKMKVSAEKYLVEITRLRDENTTLSATNVQLSSEKKMLSEEVAVRTQENEELSAARVTLTSEKESLEQEKTMLMKKVNIASVIKVQGFDVTGYKLKGSGKESDTKRAKTIDGLKICFSALENAIVSPGTERFYVRIINPLGETMASDGMGSGILRNPNTGEEVRYTQYRDVDYNNVESNVCINWQPEMPFNPGQYTVEVYNKGFLVGMSTVNLK
ncbi:MAG TPA: hypothetical protein VI603_11800 [Saprospiraceae bacterium]|nr:hypothetical protein [Saprospiraceae bacterium]